MREQAVSVQRATGATAGLVVAGVISGATVGAIYLSILIVLLDGFRGYLHGWGAYGLALGLGAAWGGVGLPLVTWLYLRHIAFWRVVLAAAIGTILFGVVGTLASRVDPRAGLVAPVIGFVVGTLWLRFRSPPVA
jgi:hypothetical protein